MPRPQQLEAAITGLGRWTCFACARRVVVSGMQQAIGVVTATSLGLNVLLRDGSVLNDDQARRGLPNAHILRHISPSNLTSTKLGKVLAA